MPRSFEDSIAEELESVFFDTNEFAKPVTIKRGQSETADVAAKVVNREYETVEEDGIVTLTRVHDFDFIATQYAIRGSQVEPRTGDRIVNAAGEIFEVSPIAGQQVFQPTASGRVIRVHTKRVQA